MKQVILFLISITLFAPVWAQNPAVRTLQKTPSSAIINAAELLHDIEVLSADDMQGRGIGTTGGLKAREYIADRFKSAGLKTFGSSYFQPFEFTNRSGAKLSGANVVGYVGRLKISQVMPK